MRRAASHINRVRGGRKSWVTRRNYANNVILAFSEIGKNELEKSRSACNKWDATDWRIQLTSRIDSRVLVITFSDFYGYVADYTDPRTARDQTAFQISDEGNNWGLSDTLKDILWSGAEVWTEKAVYKLLSAGDGITDKSIENLVQFYDMVISREDADAYISEIENWKRDLGISDEDLHVLRMERKRHAEVEF